ncbi:MAG: MBL fold metallo-hydrolase [bacterium]|nr:MBL fold metallo-hydrolase [bacterium]
MLLKYFYDEELAQASYLLGCPGAGVALVIDPSRVVDDYIRVAKENGLRIIGVAETHIHADYVSGGHELATRTGAKLYISKAGRGGEFAYDYPSTPNIVYVGDGDIIQIGGVRAEVLFTPGHTPEHIIFQVTDTNATRPIGLFTGDMLFVGDIGRPDLLEVAVGVANTAEIGAKQQFANISRLKTMPDYLQVWPGHGAGSACGKALGAIPSTTLGYEKLFNPAFQYADEQSFVDWLLDGQPPAPRYFAQMKKVNRVGATLTSQLKTPAWLDEGALADLVAKNAFIIDTRPARKFAQHHVHGTVNIPIESKQFNTWVGWFVDYSKPTYLIIEEADLPQALKSLRAIGVDAIGGVFSVDIAKKHDGHLQQATVHEVANLVDAFILDVRSRTEHDEAYIPNSHFIPMGELLGRLNELPKDTTIITQCGSGVRSQVVASLLQNRGFTVINMIGGIDAWRKAGLAVQSNELILA